MPFYIGNSQIARIKRLRDEDGNYLNSATTVVETLVDSAGNEVTGQSWPLTLSYQSGTDGEYRGALSASLSITEGYKYTRRITISNGGLTGYKEITGVAEVRES